jgi:hypothetical protein
MQSCTPWHDGSTVTSTLNGILFLTQREGLGTLKPREFASFEILLVAVIGSAPSQCRPIFQSHESIDYRNQCRCRRRENRLAPIENRVIRMQQIFWCDTRRTPLLRSSPVND